MNSKEKIEKVAKQLNVDVDFTATIQPNDLYIAAKNLEPQLLTCDKNNGSFISSKEKHSYAFDIINCAKIINIH